MWPGRVSGSTRTPIHLTSVKQIVTTLMDDKGHFHPCSHHHGQTHPETSVAALCTLGHIVYTPMINIPRHNRCHSLSQPPLNGSNGPMHRSKGDSGQASGAGGSVLALSLFPLFVIYTFATSHHEQRCHARSDDPYRLHRSCRPGPC
jgi:hypothetical protein